MALFLFLYGVSGSVFAVFGCASMLFSVTFYVGMRDVRDVDLRACVGKEISREEGVCL